MDIFVTLIDRSADAFVWAYHYAVVYNAMFCSFGVACV